MIPTCDELLSVEPTEIEETKPVIYHICGTKFSGKTTLLSKIKDRNMIYDISDFYRKHDCIIMGNMDWHRFMSVIDQLPDDVHEFLKRNEDKKVILFESSGIGKNINQILFALEEEGYEINWLIMHCPTNEDIRQRIQTRRTNVASLDKELKYRQTWVNKIINTMTILETQYKKENIKFYYFNEVANILNEAFSKHGVNEKC